MRIWQAFDGAYTALSRHATLFFIDVAVPPAKVVEALASIEEIGTSYGLSTTHLCRPCTGIVRSVYRAEPDMTDAARRAASALADVARMIGDWATLGGEARHWRCKARSASRHAISFRLTAAITA